MINRVHILSIKMSKKSVEEALRSARASAYDRKWIVGFYGDFYTYVNVAGFVLQTFVVSRIIRYGGMKLAFFVLPVLILCGAGLVAIFPILAVMRVSKIAENSTDYSLNNTLRHMLWLPTTTEMKYKAKLAEMGGALIPGQLRNLPFYLIIRDMAQSFSWTVKKRCETEIATKCGSNAHT